MAKQNLDKELLVRLDERSKNMDEKLDNIFEQCKKTNGRVTVLETERVASLENWRSRIQGGWYVIILACTAIGSVIGWIINSII